MKKRSRKITLVFVVLVLVLIAGSYAFWERINEGFGKASAVIVTEDGWTEINKMVFISSNEGVNITLVISGKEAALIDTGYKALEAERMKKYIDENKLKLSYIILTHRHPDHIANLDLFKSAGAMSYDPSTMTDGQVIELGKLRLKFLNTLGHIGKAHFSVEIMDKNILVAGDVLTNDWVPYFDKSSTELMNTIDTISSKNYSVIIPGHGVLMDAKRTIEMPKVYLENARAAARHYIKEGKTSSDLIADISITDCNKEYRYLYEINYIEKGILERVHSSLLSKIYDEEKKK